MKVGVYVLAAGASRRLGQPKQLLRFRNSTLLNHVIETCHRAGFEIVNVILGAHHEKIVPSIPEEANILINNNWNFGMATSIHLAVENSSKENEGILLLVGDQPGLSVEVLLNMKQEILANPLGIISSEYMEGFGPPVFFNKRFYYELKNLHGDKGAKDLIKREQNEVTYISFPTGNIDIDTEGDLQELSKL